MATRGDIRDAFYNRLTSRMPGTYDVTDEGGSVIDTVTLDADNIGLYQIEGKEKLPQVVYDESYQRVRHNEVGSGPEYVEYDQNGDVVAEIYREYVEAQFTIDVRASTEVAKEPIYEELRTVFGELEHGPWSHKDMHSDIIDVSVPDTASVDAPEAEDVIRGDRVQVFITFYRDYRHEEDNIESVEHGVDADDDGTAEHTFTTT